MEAAHTAHRKTQAPSDYELDAVRFVYMTVPTLLLAGDESSPVSKDASEAVNAALPNSRIVTLNGQQYVAMNTTPERFIDEMLAFIHRSNS